MNETTFSCEHCEDTGETEVMSYVYPNEPHQAFLGETQPCFCQFDEEDYYDDVADDL